MKTIKINFTVGQKNLAPKKLGTRFDSGQLFGGLTSFAIVKLYKGRPISGCLHSFDVFVKHFMFCFELLQFVKQPEIFFVGVVVEAVHEGIGCLNFFSEEANLVPSFFGAYLFFAEGEIDFNCFHVFKSAAARFCRIASMASDTGWKRQKVTRSYHGSNWRKRTIFVLAGMSRAARRFS